MRHFCDPAVNLFFLVISLRAGWRGQCMYTIESEINKASGWGQGWGLRGTEASRGCVVSMKAGSCWAGRVRDGSYGPGTHMF